MKIKKNIIILILLNGLFLFFTALWQENFLQSSRLNKERIDNNLETDSDFYFTREKLKQLSLWKSSDYVIKKSQEGFLLDLNQRHLTIDKNKWFSQIENLRVIRTQKELPSFDDQDIHLEIHFEESNQQLQKRIELWSVEKVSTATGNFWVKIIRQDFNKQILETAYYLLYADFIEDGYFRDEIDRKVQNYYSFLQYFNQWYSKFFPQPLASIIEPNKELIDISFATERREFYSVLKKGTALFPEPPLELGSDKKALQDYFFSWRDFRPTKILPLTEEELRTLKLNKNLHWKLTFAATQGKEVQDYHWWLGVNLDKTFLWSDIWKVKIPLEEGEKDKLLQLKDRFYHRTLKTFRDHFLDAKENVVPFSLVFSQKKVDLFWHKNGLTRVSQFLKSKDSDVMAHLPYKNQQHWELFFCYLLACKDNLSYLKADQLPPIEVEFWKKKVSVEFIIGQEKYAFILDPWKLRVLTKNNLVLTYIIKDEVLKSLF